MGNQLSQTSGNIWKHRSRGHLETSAVEPPETFAASQQAESASISDEASCAAGEAPDAVCEAADDEEFIESDVEYVLDDASLQSRPPSGGPWSAGGLEFFACFDSGNCAGVVETESDGSAARTALHEGDPAPINHSVVVKSRSGVAKSPAQILLVARSVRESPSEEPQLASQTRTESQDAAKQQGDQVVVQPSTESLGEHDPLEQPATRSVETERHQLASPSATHSGVPGEHQSDQVAVQPCPASLANKRADGSVTESQEDRKHQLAGQTTNTEQGSGTTPQSERCEREELLQTGLGTSLANTGGGQSAAESQTAGEKMLAEVQGTCRTTADGILSNSKGLSPGNQPPSPETCAHGGPEESEGEGVTEGESANFGKADLDVGKAENHYDEHQHQHHQQQPEMKTEPVPAKKKIVQPKQVERCFDVSVRADCAGTPFARKDCQWFHFGIRGDFALGDKFKFRMLGMSRFKETKFIVKGKLITDGMRPVVHSVPSQPRWSFTNGDIGVETLPNGEFAFLFEHTVRTNPKQGEELYFAVTFPYPLHKIRERWAALRRSLLAQSIYVHEEHLSDSIGGRPIELWTITRSSGAARRRQPALKHMLSRSKRPKIFPGRRAVFISARVHPGETPASYTLEGLLEFLASDTPAARALLERYVFHVIPVLNPDGVELGHHRTDLHGENLNRVYSMALPEEHPSVCAALAACMSAHHFQGGLRIYLDLHAHSNRRGLFLLSDKTGNREEQKLYGMALGRRCNYFEYAQCDFFNDDSSIENAGTGKNEIAQQTSAALCFTVESNYCRGHHSTQVFQPPLWKAWGKSLLEALLDMDALQHPEPLSAPVDSSTKSREIIVDLMKVAGFMHAGESPWQCPEVYPNRPSRAHPQFAIVKGPTEKHTPSQILFRHPELIGQEVEIVDSEPECIDSASWKFRLHENEGALWLSAADLEFKSSQFGVFFYGVVSATAVTAEPSPHSNQLCLLPLGTVLQVSERRLVGNSLQLRVAADNSSKGKAHRGWVSEYKAVAVDPKLGGKVQLMRLKGPPSSRARGRLYYAFPL